MNELRRQIARAQRRLWFEQFLARSVWCLSVTLAVAAVALAVPRVVSIEGLPQRWDAVWLVAALAVGLVAAAVWTIISRRTALDAAIEIDRRFGLRERVASTLSLSAAEQQSAAGRALVKDAVRAASRIDVAERFRVRFGNRAWLPLVPATLAFLLLIVANPRVATSSLDPAAPAVVAKQINTAAESARKKLADQRETAQRLGLKDAAGLFQRIEAGTKELAEKKDADRTAAAVKLNDLARELEQRRRQLLGQDSLRKQLQGLQSFGAGPGEKLTRALQHGNLEQAAAEMQKLAGELRDGKLDRAAQEDLGKRLDAVNQQLADAAQARQQALENLQRRIDAARQQGDLAQAGELQQQHDQLAAQSPQKQLLEQLAQQLGQMQQGLQRGDSQQAAQATQQAAQQLGQMQQQANERQLLDKALDQLQAAKQAMTCQNCQGAGCQKCQGGAAASSQQASSGKQPGGQEEQSAGQQSGSKSQQQASRQQVTGQPGKGIGKGHVDVNESVDPSLTASHDLHVRQQPKPGDAVFAGSVAGSNPKGEVSAAIEQEVANFGAASTDPLSNEQLPRSRREHAEEYFNLLREGK